MGWQIIVKKSNYWLDFDGLLVWVCRGVFSQL
jgi:hypothetical protein